MANLIELKNVNYLYPNTEEAVLNNINLTLETGLFHTICGVNGSGKTTLGLLLRSFIPKIYHGEMTGTYLYRNKNINEWDLSELCNEIGYVFQNPFTQMSAAKDNVFEEIAFGLENLGVDRLEIIERVQKTIKLLGLEAIQDKNPINLSGGQKQKVAIASVIVMEPKVLILDEPTSQLDPIATKEIFAILEQLKNNGTTIILIEHKIELIAKYSDTITVLEDNQVVISGEKNTVFNSGEYKNSKLELPVTLKFADYLEQENIEITPQLKQLLEMGE